MTKRPKLHKSDQSRDQSRRCPHHTPRALDKKGIAYQSVDISQDAEALERLKALGYLQAPVVVTEQDHWSGFRPDKIEELAQAVSSVA